jgi:hypothetical protein
MPGRITHYSFGRITIDGKTYTSDVIIYPGRVDPAWWRKEGHYLQPVDLADVAAAKPDAVIIGTGASGVMQVPGETVRFLESRGMEVRVALTEKAVEMFNNSPKDKVVIAALHLTC